MNSPRFLHSGVTAVLLLSLICLTPTLSRAAEAEWQTQHDQLVARLKALATGENRFGAAYQPLYHAALPWYEQYGGNPRHAVDDWMVPPEQYATELAQTLERDGNFLAEQLGAQIPLVFEQPRAGGGVHRANYWIRLPAGFGEAGRTFPLVIGLHGSGWLGHKLSFVRASSKPVPGRVITVTPINEQGPWQIDFLNAYLDELIRILPVDVDRVYVEGHSLGGMATWEWAQQNPERFAAISPRSAIGEPYRAARLKNVPSWVIHGENDTVITPGFSDQMITALENVGASVRYSLLRDVGHNMPQDLDEGQVVDWYLRQTRSHLPAPRDPVEALNLNQAGFSPWEIVERPAEAYWHTGPMDIGDLSGLRAEAHSLYRKAHELGERLTSPFLEERDLRANKTTLWLAVPEGLRQGKPVSPTATTLPAARYLRFHFRGPTAKAFAHLAAIKAEVVAGGHVLGDPVWIRWLSIWRDADNAVAEYSIPLK